MSIIHLPSVSDEGPTDTDLAKIEREWPLIAAELDVVNAQIAQLTAGPFASELDWRRLRRAEHRVLAVQRKLAERAGGGIHPCACPSGVITSTIGNGGEQCSSCGSTWDRNDQIITWRGLDGDEVA
jgi:hypothetical protein